MKIKVRKNQGCDSYRKKTPSGEGGAGVVFDPSPYGIGLSKIDLFGDFACRDFACLYKIRNKKSGEQH